MANLPIDIDPTTLTTLQVLLAKLPDRRTGAGDQVVGNSNKTAAAAKMVMVFMVLSSMKDLIVIS